MDPIPVAGPSITEREIDYVTDAVRRCWYGTAGEYHERFEAAFAKYVGTKYAVALPSCTSAIHLALAALDIGPGDEVIVPDVTWIASAAPIDYVGADPVFADIEEASWCVSGNTIEACLTPRTRAIIVVDLYGNMPDLPAIRALADRQGIALIEDAAEAFGSSLEGRRAGSFGDAGVFSFHGSKTMTTGEGGMLVTDCSTLRERVLFLRDHGRSPGDVSFLNREVAFKYKISSMQAALGLAQVERADELVEIKRRIHRWYSEAIADFPAVQLNAEPPGVVNSYWMTSAVIDPALRVSKQCLGTYLLRRGIETRPFFSPLSSLPAYADRPAATAARQRNRVAYQISPSGINLPSAMSLTQDQVQHVARTLIQGIDALAGSTAGETRTRTERAATP